MKKVKGLNCWRTFLGALIWLGLGSTSSLGQLSALNSFVIACCKVPQPQFLPTFQEMGLPSVFSENAFSIYLVYNKAGSIRLEWIIVVADNSRSAWEPTANENNWNAVTRNSFRYFSRGDSSILGDISVLEFIGAHNQTPSESAMSGELLPFWNTALQHLWENEDASITLLEELIPDLESAGDFAAYLQWWAEDLSGASAAWQTDPLIGHGQTSVSVIAVPGTRLYRLIEQRSSSDLSFLDFVPATAGELSYGIVNGSRAVNYFNHLYEGTEKIVHNSAVKLREQFSKLDTSIFDRWDGSSVKWTPAGSDTHMLMLGGYFLPTDLSDLFDMISQLDLEEFGITIRLDEDNSVVGLSRLRSLEIIQESVDEDESVSNVFYLGIAKGYLVVAEDDLQIIDLIFKLNSREKEADSIRSLINENPGLALAIFENRSVRQSLEFYNGKIIFRQAGIAGGVNKWLAAYIKNFLL